MNGGDEGSRDCVRCLLGVLILISSFVRLVGVTESIFSSKSHNVFVSSDFYGDTILSTLICPNGEVKKEALLPERWHMTWRLGKRRVVGWQVCQIRVFVGTKEENSPAGSVRGLEMPRCWNNKSKPAISVSFLHAHGPGFLNSPSLSVDRASILKSSFRSTLYLWKKVEASELWPNVFRLGVILFGTLDLVSDGW